MKLITRFVIGLKALRQLGLNETRLFALYQLGLYTGHYRRILSSSLDRLQSLEREPYLHLHSCLPSLPGQQSLLELYGEQLEKVYREADEILHGKVRLFGDQPVPLIFALPEPLLYWTEYEKGENRIADQDIKYIWEPARFGWACRLALAYHLSSDERYAQAFWSLTERFFTSNPPFWGPHWSSAQEVAIRLIALAFSYQVFSRSSYSSCDRISGLAKVIATHAVRIPPTLIYARSQNNNHLITEALGLYTASAMLPEHPLAPAWQELGWHWLLNAYRTQIDSDGTYIQHSTNYHRLMLQAALWFLAVHRGSSSQEGIPPDVMEGLAKATHWLWKLLDPETGRLPNLGHNDGSYILPLSICPYDDYRPVIAAACQSFMNSNLEPEGPWNDMSLWLSPASAHNRKNTGFQIRQESPDQNDLPLQSPFIIRNQANNSWAMLRVATFHARPAHADQLHLDLWWRGLNLAADPGTYLYNSPPPWDNSLTSALVHNTLVVDGQEFMLRAGRFLYLDWAQAKVIAHQSSYATTNAGLTVQHDGYRKIGITHTRMVNAFEDGHWEIIDQIDGEPKRIHSARLHWLLPDWDYKIEESSSDQESKLYETHVHSPFGWVTLHIGLPPTGDKKLLHSEIFQLARAGELLHGSGTISPITGWVSPTYGVKKPALACLLTVTQSLPIEIKSEWFFPDES